MCGSVTRFTIKRIISTPIIMTALTSTLMVLDRRRAPKMISKEPITNRNTARAIALYGTFGGLFLNCRF